MIPTRAPVWLHRYLTWEQSLMRLSNRVHDRRYWRTFFAACSRLGDGIGWYVLTALVVLIHGLSALAPMLWMLASAVVAIGIYVAIKRLTARPRPLHAHGEIHHSVAPLDQYSFPSGHTLHAVNFTVQLVAFLPELGWLLVPFALAIAASRLVLGLHYLSDVLVGAALGGAIAYAALYLQSVF
ncbi:MAG: phosphatase PAP2 family protein [Halothiobacillaceae bacterium]